MPNASRQEKCHDKNNHFALIYTTRLWLVLLTGFADVTLEICMDLALSQF
jgi:hypothetical protein